MILKSFTTKSTNLLANLFLKMLVGLPDRWQDMNTICIPLYLMLIATAPFFLLIKPPHPPTSCLSTSTSETQNSRAKKLGT